MNPKKYSFVLKDFSLNFITSFMLTGTIQLIVYPRLSKILDADANGKMLTLMAVVNVVTSSFGGNLFYARLIQNEDYKRKNLLGDYQILLSIFTGISAIVMAIATSVMRCPFQIGIGVIAATILLVMHSYYLVTYRINIDYKSNFFAHVVLCIGYISGVFLFGGSRLWPWIFCETGLLGLMYIWFHDSIIQEPFVRTELFMQTLMKTMIFIIGGFIGNIYTYLDRFIIYPSLGGASVSYYMAASFFAKTMGLISSPLISVLLGYFTSGKIILSKKKYYMLYAVTMLCGFIYLVMSNSIGHMITSFIYPTLYDNAKPYIFLASIGAILGCVYGFSNVVVMALGKTYWQTVIPVVRTILYLVIGLSLSQKYGLTGLCVALIVVNLITDLISFVLGGYYVERQKTVESEA